MRFKRAALVLFLCGAAASAHGGELSDSWEAYKGRYLQDGRVVSLDEGGITTSEGQGYAMLRAVWANDRDTFAKVWAWTQGHLQVRPDRLFAWKWKDQVLDSHSATDADTDIALALILAARRFSEPSYQEEVRPILYSLWNAEVLPVGERNFIVSGDWSPAESSPTLHVAYLAPYAYAVFARADPGHAWQTLVDSSYAVLRWIYFDQHLALPPEVVLIDKKTGQLSLPAQPPSFGYDAFPIFWRVALDKRWFGRDQADLRRRMLDFFEKEWKEKGKFLDRYGVDGRVQSNQEGLALYATVHSLAWVEDRSLAREIEKKKLSGLWSDTLAPSGRANYYLQNWLWFDKAFEDRRAKRFNGLFGFW